MKIPFYDIEKTIALGFSCNNNSEEEITRALDPWYDKVDYIIAVEGRYRVPYSPEMMKRPIPPKFGQDTESILRKHYGAKVAYSEYYGLQQDKRQKYLDRAGLADCDVLIVWDSDDILHPEYNTDWNRFYRQIALLSEFAEDRPALVNQWIWIPHEGLWPRQNNVVDANSWREYHRIHINPSKQKYVLNHYTFAPKESTERQIVEFSANKENVAKKNPYLLYPLGTCDGIRITTNRKLRTAQDLEYGDGWSFQWMHEETYRTYLMELQALHLDEIYEKQYREPFTYYFDKNGRPVMYTKEEQENFNALEL